MSATANNCVMAILRVVGPIGGNRANVLIGSSLIQEFRQHKHITEVDVSDFDHPNLQCFFFSSNIYLAQNASREAIVFVGIPFILTLGFKYSVLSVSKRRETPQNRDTGCLR